MSPEQTIKTELTVWKWAGKQGESKPTSEHLQPSKQTVQSAGRSLSNNDSNAKDTLYLTYESRKNLDSFSLYITVRNIPNKICKTVSKHLKFFAVVHVL